jgi:hypothetical protein
VNLAATLKNLVVGSITADIKRALLASSSTPTRDETAEGPMGDVMADVYTCPVDRRPTSPSSTRAACAPT